MHISEWRSVFLLTFFVGIAAISSAQFIGYWYRDIYCTKLTKIRFIHELVKIIGEIDQESETTARSMLADQRVRFLCGESAAWMVRITVRRYTVAGKLL